MPGLGLASAYGAKASADSLVDLIAAKLEERDLAEKKARQAQLDADARETTAFNRRRLVEQDERQRRIDAQAELEKNTTRLMKLAEHFPGARVPRAAFGDNVPADLDALILKPLDPTIASRSITGFASMPGAASREGAVMTEDREAIDPGTVEIQMPESEKRRIADLRAVTAAEKAEKDRKLKEEQQRALEQHRERMAQLALLRINQGGGSGGTVSAGTKEEVDALATMVESNPDLLKNLAPKDRGVILRRIAGRGTNRLRNQRADNARTTIDTALESIRRLRGDDPKTGAKGQGVAGFGGAFGAKEMSSLYGLLDTPIAGTDAADASALLETLRTQIARPQLEAMKGLGAMSDREFAALSSSASTLGSSLKEATALAELDRLEEQFIAARAKLPADLEEPAIVDDPRAPSGGTRPAAKPRVHDPSFGLNGMVKPRMVRVQAPNNGPIREVPEHELPMFIAAGGKVVK
jgi:hypothetical protein